MSGQQALRGLSAQRELWGDAQWRRWVLAFACLPPFLLAAAELYLFDDLLGFPLDDPWIHLQFARNLRLGEGLSYDAGRLVRRRVRQRGRLIALTAERCAARAADRPAP